MKYVITGGAGNISRPIVEKLLTSGAEVSVIGRNQEYLKPLIDKGAKPLIGSVTDVSFLTKAFAGADAVYSMVPPIWEVDDWKGYIGSIGENFAKAITANKVKYVVNLSSVGAHLPDGTGPLVGLYRVEQALNGIADLNVLHLRPAYFYNNLMANIGMVKHAGIIGSNFAIPSGKMPIVDPADIANVAIEELMLLNFTGSSVRYIASAEVGTDDIAKALGAAIGKPDLQWIKFADEQAVKGGIDAGLQEEISRNYAELGHAMDDGSVFSDYFANHQVKVSGVTLDDFAKKFAAAYNQ